MAEAFILFLSGFDEFQYAQGAMELGVFRREGQPAGEQAALQGFTFQYDADHILLTVHEFPSHMRSLFGKAPGVLKLLHFNQFPFDPSRTGASRTRSRLLSWSRTS